ncbi:hypothetical protein M4I17_04495 [Enterococcus thailandicus]|uniref:hypothetical protein n=1 Tax=Enterococcus thailandicus TaxID=417368 RepID=UPI00244D95E6|nr:hypothetical protein [Enterococcus thailandicus]MDG3374507.1 hypothetical protein [Vibrio parahaemolyticus]MDK4351667.1 hypothetical protein [Enterococcus thailandicus]MDT2735483.1 hypothetical protein [Enterococcus thailandicus]GMC00411.1 hypothetical protein K2F_06700 [Enterococcus thailandicus]
MQNKFFERFRLVFEVAFILAVIIYVFLGKYVQANYFLVLYLVISLDVNLKNIKRSLDYIWYFINKQNEGNADE